MLNKNKNEKEVKAWGVEWEGGNAGDCVCLSHCLHWYLCFALVHHAMLCYAMLCYAMLNVKSLNLPLSPLFGLLIANQSNAFYKADLI